MGLGGRLRWSWTSSVEGRVRLSTAGSDFDTVLIVFTGGSLDTLELLTANDDSTNGLTSEVVFDSVPGTEYQIAVAGFDDGAGNIHLSLTLNPDSLMPPRLTYNHDAEGETLTVSWSSPSNLFRLETSTDLTFWSPTETSVTQAGTEFQSAASFPSDEVKMFFRLPSSTSDLPLSSGIRLRRTVNLESVIPSGPDGIAYSSSTGHLFFVDSSSSLVSELTADGELVNQFHHSLGNAFPEGLFVIENGHLLVSDEPTPGIGTLIEYDLEGNQISILELSRGADPTGVTWIPDPESFFVSDDNDMRLYHFTADGSLINEIDTTQFGSFEPEGIEFDPLTNTLFLVDDNTSFLYQLTLDGQVLGTTDIASLAGVSGPEGLALDVDGRRLFVAFDNGRSFAEFALSQGSFEPTTDN